MAKKRTQTTRGEVRAEPELQPEAAQPAALVASSWPGAWSTAPVAASEPLEEVVPEVEVVAAPEPPAPEPPAPEPPALAATWAPGLEPRALPPLSPERLRNLVAWAKFGLPVPSSLRVHLPPELQLPGRRL